MDWQKHVRSSFSVDADDIFHTRLFHCFFWKHICRDSSVGHSRGLETACISMWVCIELECAGLTTKISKSTIFAAD